MIESGVQYLALRNLYKRLYWVFEKEKIAKPYLMVHQTHYTYPIHSFADIDFHGESYKPNRRFEFSNWMLGKNINASPLAGRARPDTPRSFDAPVYHASFRSIAGVPMLLLPQYGFIESLGKDPVLAREMLAWSFLHDTLLWPSFIYVPTVKEFWEKVNIPFNMASSKFKGYWGNNGVSALPDCIRVSYYYKENNKEFLIAAVNHSDNATQAEILLPSSWNAVHAVDPETDRDIPLNNGKISILIPSHNLRAIRVFSQNNNK